MIIALFAYLIGLIATLIINYLLDNSIWYVFPMISSGLIFAFLLYVENYCNEYMNVLIIKNGKTLDEDLQNYLRINSCMFVPMYKFMNRMIASSFIASIKYIYIGLSIAVFLLLKEEMFFQAIITALLIVLLFSTPWKLKFYNGTEFDKVAATRRYLKNIGKNVRYINDETLLLELEKWNQAKLFLNKIYNRMDDSVIQEIIERKILSERLNKIKEDNSIVEKKRENKYCIKCNEIVYPTFHDLCPKCDEPL